MRILVAEDETVLSEQIKKVLMTEGHVVDIAPDGEEAGFLGSTEPYDMVVLDLGLPKRDGISVLKEWRKDGIDTPVLILTARDSWSDKVDGLDAGADDYMTKPFHVAELAARVRVILRRQSGRINSLFEKADFSFDIRSGRALKDGLPVDLTSQEVAVLSYLVHNSGRLISRTELSEHIY